MSQFFRIHPDNPQTRLIRGAVEILRAGGVVAYPTDSGYALGCRLDQKSALDRIHRTAMVTASDALLTLATTRMSGSALSRCASMSRTRP